MVAITPLRMVPIQCYRHFLCIINEKQPTFKYAIEGWQFLGWVFDWKNLVLRSNLTLLNANISKKSTFA